MNTFWKKGVIKIQFLPNTILIQCLGRVVVICVVLKASRRFPNWGVGLAKALPRTLPVGGKRAMHGRESAMAREKWPREEKTTREKRNCARGRKELCTWETRPREEKASHAQEKGHGHLYRSHPFCSIDLQLLLWLAHNRRAKAEGAPELLAPLSLRLDSQLLLQLHSPHRFASPTSAPSAFVILLRLNVFFLCSMPYQQPTTLTSASLLPSSALHHNSFICSSSPFLLLLRSLNYIAYACLNLGHGYTPLMWHVASAWIFG